MAIDRLYQVTKEAATYQSELESIRLHPEPQQPPSSPIVEKDEMKVEEDNTEAKLSCYDKLIAELEQTITSQKEEIAVAMIHHLDL